jgi:hypothetical protein
MAILGFFGSKGNHPLADPKDAREAMAPLAALKPANALEELSAWLEPLPGVDDLKLDRRADILHQLDETGILHARRLARDYLTSPAVARPQGQRLWSLGHAYWQKMVAAYADCQARISATPRALDQTRMAMNGARALHAYGAQLKWQQFRYGPNDPAMWAAAGRIYLQAFAGRYVDRPLRLYPNATEDTSVEKEYLKLLVFHASSMDKLLPLEVELAERLIAWGLPHFDFTDKVRPENVYWVDAAQALPPTRLAKIPEPAPSLRFFSTGRVLEVIEQLKARIDRIKDVPPELPLGGQYPAATVLGVLGHLEQCWAPKPPMRGSDRHRVTNLLAVIHTMDEIRARLSGEGGAQQGETWVAENISRGGMAARLPLANSDWLQVGSLIAMRPERSDQWLVGIIRRFQRESQTEGSAGIETIGKTPQAIHMECSGVRNEAILLESAVRKDEMVSMVLPERAWEDFIPATIEVGGSKVRLLPFGISFRGADFVIGRYRVDAVG